LREPGSALQLLEESLLREFPEVKVTFFVVAGALSPYTRHQPFTYAASLDATAKSTEFFRDLSRDPRFELAYHGFNHGSPGARTEDFAQEWREFPSRQAAVQQTRAGLEIFRRTTGSVPQGGKYGGWDYNDFAGDAVNDCGFLWWCRDWTPRDVTGRTADSYYEPQFFGQNLVLALPSTVHGQLWNRGQIDLLLARRQIIAVEEHIAPVRPDGLIQTPNVVDDMQELRRLFRYLRRRDIWYATGSEVASYAVARERSLIYDVEREGFSLRYDGRFEKPLLTLRIGASSICTAMHPAVDVIAPDGTIVPSTECRFDKISFHHLVTVPVMNGKYRVQARAA
jgi:peptidoglycan/xylan/chitin deacetylase (PgdA/CDA1 family)